MSKQFDLIIFDWDGTLVDSIDWIVRCLQHAAVECGCQVPDKESAREIIGLSIERAMETLFPGIDGSTQEQLIRLYSQQFFSKQFGREDLFEGVYDMLGNFKQDGYKLAVATGKKNAGLVEAMTSTGVVEMFDITRSADQTASKPNPLMIDEIVAAMNVSKARTLMVGDSVHDLQMARNAGVAAIAVACGAHRCEVLRQHQPLHCLPRTSALMGMI
ncbi:HAD family hydrolase [Methylomarinum vadi]|uniref:HAD family hydrolase n=1 Tax=Methylomarinum vadi TaxID=438855 RepID=UPI0004DFC13E|nr:HAD-IIIA family hydrolase [Methylomarinum vadi]